MYILTRETEGVITEKIIVTVYTTMGKGHLTMHLTLFLNGCITTTGIGTVVGCTGITMKQAGLLVHCTYTVIYYVHCTVLLSQ